jgi:hypothetical protein
MHSWFNRRRSIATTGALSFANFFADACEPLAEAFSEASPFRFARPRLPATGQRAVLPTVLTAFAMLAGSGEAGRAADDIKSAPAAAPAASDELTQKLERMEKRIRLLERQLQQKNGSVQQGSGSQALASISDANPSGRSVAPSSRTDAGRAAAPPTKAPSKGGILGLTDSPISGLSIGAYGEFFFGAMQNPAVAGQWQAGYDARRFVLLPTYEITDNIIFNAEIEFEHAGSGFDNDDKLHGTAEIEQVWIDFKISDPFNWRAPGVDLVPIGYINQHHEPTQFYSVLRPELYNGLIPSTWKVPGTSIYGTITDGVRYQLMLSASNEDFGDSFDSRADANTTPPPGTPYFPGIDGVNGLAFSNPPLGDFRQLNNTLAVSGRLDFTPLFIPGLAWSTSGYYSPNTTPRGAHDDMGNLLGRSSLAIADAEFRYRIPDTGWELRGEGVYARFGNPANLRANNDSDPTNNVGNAMYGYSGEIAYHIPLGTILNSQWEAVPFYRYTAENLQTGGFAGTDLNLPTGAGHLRFHNVGLAVFPSPKLVLKGTYQRQIDREPVGANSDSILGAVGFFF